MRVELIQRRRDAEDMQPWRCATCNEAVSQVRRNDCACIRALRHAEQYAQGVEEPFCACGRRISECDGSRKGCRTQGATR